MQTLTEKIYKESIADLKKQFAYKNDMAVSRLTMVSLNVGIKATDSDNKFLSYLATQVSNIAGQKAVLTKARKAISTFKLRENLPIGCRVTLRGKKMYQFLDRLVNIALPRIRDFRGLSAKGFNQSNHYSFGIKEHSIFLEVDLDNIPKVFGMNITIATTAKTKEEALYLLKKLNFPIK
ncbi:MAG: 50S ribosomal protein L5 [Alphaproteobacteria bacterium RIFCSPLOWO2_01_FULL_40_26]|nr:MAG: 50S ribosomal protein L5 [Alphaproteobacteria bacterium RIFCSPHIGHO2_02_FULL_40_34]OFW87853.1 MAG: 50S ribosomal protein L5 [Alphaproteobacteria bacterium RIFCSPHIGHO2_01_FULL_40_8]OFW95088.1 MAG: 50S ribosomal protein L5 [Alphaproteobacteria bacterium RIFCSPLOWO2_01_FULL_40_26]OFX09089.1 MAG: 50S ribosomal protein L5 [Alphaproteobacteria bacterium RIFCSPLOWO2_02_FULL_40_19]OFX12169.1 MAG: 50S ribosomal protein L5 [Alphaproteobacteria bacterium RIFCSPLOWO2_12_FULL_40_11]